MQIWVTNGSEKAIKGRYNGEDYEFPVGVPTPVEQDAAAHIFGFGVSDKSRALTRLGWYITSDQEEAAVARLAQIQFGASPPDAASAVAESDSPPSGNAGPLVNAGEVEGDGEAQADPSPKTTRLKKGSEKIV